MEYKAYRTGDKIWMFFSPVDENGRITGQAGNITATVIDESGNSHALADPVAEETGTDGIYSCSFVPDIAGEWKGQMNLPSPVIEGAWHWSVRNNPTPRFLGGVWIDSTNGSAGTTYPLGERDTPVDNFADAKTIADANNIRTFMFALGDYTIPAGDYTNYEFVSTVSYSTTLTFSNGAGGEFTVRDANVTGGLGTASNCYLFGCRVADPTNAAGYFKDCILVGTIAVRGNLVMVNCGGDRDNSATDLDLDLVGAVASTHVSLHDYSGEVTVSNCDTASFVVALSVDGAEVTLASTCTAGTIEVRGHGQLTDSSGGSASVTTTGWISQETINAQADTAISDAALATAAALATVDTNVDSILVDTAVIGTPAGADIAADIAAVKTDTAAVLVDTADMQPKLGTPAGADMSADIAAVKVDTAATLVDTAVIGAPAGASVSADIAAVKADTATLTGRITAALFTGITSLADWLASMAGTHGDATAVSEINAAGAGSGTYDDNDDSQQAIRDEGSANWLTGSGTGLSPMASGACPANGTSTTIALAAGSSGVNDTFKGCRIGLTSGTGAGQARMITAYNGTTKVATVGDAWVTTPLGPADTNYEVQAADSHVGLWRDAQPGALVSGDVSAYANGVDSGVVTSIVGTPAGASVSADIAAVKADTAAVLVDTADMQPKLGTPAGADMSADIAAVKSDTAATLVDTADMQPKLGTPAGADMSADIAAVKADTAATLVDTAVIGTPAGASVSADIAAVKSDTAATLVDTADMQPKLGTPAGADMSADIAAVKTDTAATLVDTADMQPKLGTPAADISADIAAVKVDTAATLVDTADMQPKLGTPAGADMSADIAAVQADTDDIQTRLPAALVSGKMDSDIGAITGGDSAEADALKALMGGVIVAAVKVGAAPTTTTFEADGFTEATDDHFIGRLITFTSGVLNGQQTDVTDYTGSTQTFTVTALTEAPSNNDTFVIH